MTRLSPPSTPTGVSQHVAIAAICSAPPRHHGNPPATHSLPPPTRYLSRAGPCGDGVPRAGIRMQNTRGLASRSAAQIWPHAENGVSAEEGRLTTWTKNAVLDKEREFHQTPPAVQNVVRRERRVPSAFGHPECGISGGQSRESFLSLCPSRTICMT